MPRFVQVTIVTAGVSRIDRTPLFKIDGVLTGHLAAVSAVQPLYVKYWAAASPVSRTSGYGSALPYASEEIAFSASPNYGVVPVVDGQFSFAVRYPNAYYVDCGSRIVPSTLYYKVSNEYNQDLTPVYEAPVGDQTILALAQPMHKIRMSGGELKSQWRMLAEQGRVIPPPYLPAPGYL